MAAADDMQQPIASRYFPHPVSADEFGLVAVDPRLDVQRLLDAYQHGIFPWPCRWPDAGHIPESREVSMVRSSMNECDLEDLQEEQNWLVGWYSPDPRAVVPPGGLRIPTRLLRKLNNERFRFSVNLQFEKVLNQCGLIGNRAQNRWLTPGLMRALVHLHKLGYAHSIEVYDRRTAFETLCGGLYGVAIGAAFFAESMFFFTSDASKAAICALDRILNTLSSELLDIQQISPHLSALGAVEVERSRFLRLLAQATAKKVHFPSLISEPMGYHQVPQAIQFAFERQQN